MNIAPGLIGIDVAKHRFEVFDAASGRSIQVPNTAPAIRFARVNPNAPSSPLPENSPLPSRLSSETTLPSSPKTQLPGSPLLGAPE